MAEPRNIPFAIAALGAVGGLLCSELVLMGMKGGNEGFTVRCGKYLTAQLIVKESARESRAQIGKT